MGVEQVVTVTFRCDYPGCPRTLTIRGNSLQHCVYIARDKRWRINKNDNGAKCDEHKHRHNIGSHSRGRQIPIREFICEYCKSIFYKRAWSAFVCDDPECREKQQQKIKENRKANRRLRRNQKTEIIKSKHQKERGDKMSQKPKVTPHYSNGYVVWVGSSADKCDECVRLNEQFVEAGVRNDVQRVGEIMTERYEHQRDVHGIPYIKNDKSTAERRAEAGAQQPSLV